MPKAAIAIGLAGLLLAAAAGTTEAAPFVPLPNAAIEGLSSDLAQASWTRCWRDSWGRRHCRRCWRDRWGRVRCGSSWRAW
jgi:hypothetical protein